MTADAEGSATCPRRSPESDRSCALADTAAAHHAGHESFRRGVGLVCWATDEADRSRWANRGRAVFHARADLTFQRLPGGGVRVAKAGVVTDLDALTWTSVVAAVGPTDGAAGGHGRGRRAARCGG